MRLYIKVILYADQMIAYAIFLTSVHYKDKDQK
jgi:hypothetical protein